LLRARRSERCESVDERGLPGGTRAIRPRTPRVRRRGHAYWKAIGEKRQLRNAKRRANEPIELDDYVLTQPPVLCRATTAGRSGGPSPDPTVPRRPDIPVVSDFLRAAAEQFRFVPQPPESELAFKQAYVRVASAAGLTRDQIVRVYAFETGATAPMTSRPD